MSEELYGHNRMINIYKEYGPVTKEGRPYLECPHCEKYDYRLVRKIRSRGIVFGDTYEVDEMICENCEYKEDLETNEV